MPDARYGWLAVAWLAVPWTLGGSATARAQAPADAPAPAEDPGDAAQTETDVAPGRDDRPGDRDAASPEPGDELAPRVDPAEPAGPKAAAPGPRLAAPPPDTPVPAPPGARPVPPTYEAPRVAAVPVAAPETPPPVEEPTSPETPLPANRIELVAFQAANGFALGIETCVLLDCFEDREFFGAGLLGAAAGFGLGFALTTGGVRPGTSASLNTGFVLGLWHAGAIVGMVGPLSGEAMAGALMLGQVGGIGLGALLDATLRPTEGRVLMARAASLWSSALTGMVIGALPGGVDQGTVFGAMLAVGDLAFVLAGTAGWDALRMSRRRVLITSALGLAGTGTGMALGFAFAESPDVGVTLGVGAGGMLVGLALGLFLTRDRVEEVVGDGFAPSFAVTPTPGGAMVRFGGGF